MTKTLEDLLRQKAILLEIERREQQNLFGRMFPDQDTPWRGEVFHARHKYAPHLEFMDATKKYREVCMMASNRSGKTQTGAYALSVWLTGQYPDWWTGKRFPGAVRCWAAGKTNETVRDIIQDKLCGRVVWQDGHKTVSGTGMIPGALLGGVTWRSGIADTVDTIQVMHLSGEPSTLGLKSYQQGRGSFEGTSQHAVWLDEEPPLDISSECLTRTATVDGLLIYTFTPLLGMSDVAMRFLP